MVFLNVSFDKDTLKWKTFLKNNPSVSGRHILAMTKKGRPLAWDDYLVWSIPRYILIDHRGNIVDPDTYRPSSREIRSLIDQALKKIAG